MKNKYALNPYLPTWEYVPDAEPHIFGDRLYVFGSHDRFGGRQFCLNDYVCWSAPVGDLSDWRYEGVIYRKTRDPKNRAGKLTMYAPDVCRGCDGRYYLYYGLNGLARICVAVCDEPAGRYEFYGYVRHPDGKIYGRKKGDFFPFDPGVINDGGRVWLYSGFSPRGGLLRLGIDLLSREKGALGNQVLELDSDMLSVKSVKPLLPGTLNSAGTGFEGHEFYEASSIRKFGGRYYLIYSSVLSHELAYAVSERPDGGFVYGGTLHSNCDLGFEGNDRALAYWGNNHGSVEFVNGKYYIFGHRHTYRRECCRQGVAHELEMDENGRFSQAESTCCGLNGAPLGIGRYEAGIACNLFAKQGAVKSTFFKNRRLAALHPCIMQEGGDREGDPCLFVRNMRDGSVAGYKYFECGCSELILTVRGGAGRIEVLFDCGAPASASVELTPGDEAREYSLPLKIQGKRAIYIKYLGGDSIDLLSLELK